MELHLAHNLGGRKGGSDLEVHQFCPPTPSCDERSEGAVLRFLSTARFVWFYPSPPLQRNPRGCCFRCCCSSFLPPCRASFAASAYFLQCEANHHRIICPGGPGPSQSLQALSSPCILGTHARSTSDVHARPRKDRRTCLPQTVASHGMVEGGMVKHIHARAHVRMDTLRSYTNIPRANKPMTTCAAPPHDLLSDSPVQLAA